MHVSSYYTLKPLSVIVLLKIMVFLSLIPILMKHLLFWTLFLIKRRIDWDLKNQLLPDNICVCLSKVMYNVPRSSVVFFCHILTCFSIYINLMIVEDQHVCNIFLIHWFRVGILYSLRYDSIVENDILTFRYHSCFCLWCQWLHVYSNYWYLFQFLIK